MSIQMLDANEIKEISGGFKFSSVTKTLKKVNKTISDVNTGINMGTSVKASDVTGAGTNSPATDCAGCAMDVLTYKAN